MARGLSTNGFEMNSLQVIQKNLDRLNEVYDFSQNKLWNAKWILKENLANSPTILSDLLEQGVEEVAPRCFPKCPKELRPLMTLWYALLIVADDYYEQPSRLKMGYQNSKLQELYDRTKQSSIILSRASRANFCRKMEDFVISQRDSREIFHDYLEKGEANYLLNRSTNSGMRMQVFLDHLVNGEESQAGGSKCDLCPLVCEYCCLANDALSWDKEREEYFPLNLVAIKVRQGCSESNAIRYLEQRVNDLGKDICDSINGDSFVHLPVMSSVLSWTMSSNRY